MTSKEDYAAKGTDRTRDLGQERRATRDAEEVAVGPLLARANLLRMRRQWDEAIAVCTEALRRAPESSTAHSLMGDIYEAQGKSDDAVQWFSMAVDLAPDNAADRQKLDRAIAARRAVLAADPRLSGAAPGGHAARAGSDRTAVLGAPEPARRTAELTIDWFDRVFPPGRAEGIARMILALCAVLAVLLVGAAGFMYLSLSRNVALGGDGAGNDPGGPAQPPAPAPPVRMEVVGSTQPGAPGLVGKSPERPAARTAATPTPVPTRTPAAPPPPAPPAAVPENGNRLKMLRAELDRALPNTLTLADVQIDTNQSRLTCDLLVTLNEGEDPTFTRERILRAAVFVGRNATLQDPRLQRVAIQVRPRLTGAYATRPSSAVFLGETTASLLREADPVTGSPADLRGLFTYSWWSPEYGASATLGSGVGASRPANP